MLKKLTALLIIASSFLTMMNAAEKYAVLITGEKAPVGANNNSPYAAFWMDTYLMWEMLYWKGFDPDNIYVLYADGIDCTEGYVDLERYSAIHAGFKPEYWITDYSATNDNLEAVALELRRKSTENDFLFVWTFGHGTTDGGGASNLQLYGNESISDVLFANLFNGIKANKKVYWMSQCYGGGFEEELTHNLFSGEVLSNVIFSSAAQSTQMSYFADNMPAENKSQPEEQELPEYIPDYPSIEIDWYGVSNPQAHWEYNFHMYAATNQFKQHKVGSEFYYKNLTLFGVYYGTVPYSSVDGFYDPDIYYQYANSVDGLTTMDEVIQWERYYESSEGEEPVYSDPGNNAIHTNLKYPTILNQELSWSEIYGMWGGFVASDSYMIQDELRGDIAVLSDLFVWNEGIPFNFRTGADVTMMQDKYITLCESKMICEEGSKVTGIGNNRIDVEDFSDLTLNGAVINNLELNAIKKYSSFYMQDTYGSIILGSNNIFEGSTINIDPLCYLIIDENSTFELMPGLLNLEPGSNMTLRDGSIVNVQNMSGYVMVPDTDIKINGDATIQGDFSTSAGSTIIVGINSKLRIGANSNFTIDPASYVKLEQGAELIVEDGAVCTLPAGASITTTAGSKITVFGTFSSNGTFEYKSNIAEDEPDKGGTWQGIKAEVGSEIYLTYTSIRHAETAINGTPAVCNVVYSEFAECTNGIELINCNNYNIFNNEFTGSNVGIGISLSLSNGYLIDNIVQSYSNGIAILSGAPYLSDNTIRNNGHYGLYVTGYNTYPQLIEPATSGKNNEIYNNGLNNIEDGGQIYLKYSASVYMNNGRNNIYSEPFNQVPVVPCIKGVSHLTSKVVLPWIKGIPAENNYWGSYRVYEEYFDLYERYRLHFDPYSETKFIDENGNIIPFGTLTFEEKLLSKAVEFELDGKLDQAVKKLETIVSKEEELEISLRSEEYYLAVAKLPDLYVRQSMELEPLIKLYDTNLSSEDESVNKKFFKEMKVATHIKGKKYDDAIAIAEEMKAEAETEGEVMLAEFDIAVARMMKEAENSGKGRNESTTTDISALLDKLTGVEDKGNPAGITDAEIPKTATLYQNYPNPFNPVTQIKFALAKTGNVKLSIYNINGQKVAELLNGFQNSGVHSVNFDGSSLNSGVYYYTLETDGKALTRKMLLTK